MDSFQNYIGVLTHCSLFKSMVPQDILYALKYVDAKVATYAKGEYLVSSSEGIDKIIIVLSGKLKVFHDGESIRECLVEQLSPKECFGIAYCLAERPCFVAVRTATKSTVIVLDAQKLQQVDNSRISVILNHNLLQNLAEKVIILAQKIDYLSIKSLRSRLCSYLINRYATTGKQEFALNITLTNLADYLGVSRPALSRELGKLQEEGLVRFNAKIITLVDLKKLSDATI